MPYYIYIVECKDGSYYSGYTTNIDTRIKKHNSAKTGAKYTRSRRPVKLVYSEEFQSKSNALKREIVIKNLSRKDKQELIDK